MRVVKGAKGVAKGGREGCNQFSLKKNGRLSKWCEYDEESIRFTASSLRVSQFR